ncbi:MAG TPA: gamma carbonic anhydrase family protein [Gammaproteobacteria bacterium]|nr:gamma carbonic anhydrase family protein [Gammaproteobacteria bacterium]
MPVRQFQSQAPVLGQRVYVDDTALVIGQVILADDVSLWPYVVARGDVNAIRIGARSNIQDLSVLHVTHDGPYSPGGFALAIGEDVTVGHRCVLHACTIGDRCLVGMGSIVMDGAVIEDEVLLAAGSLVGPGKRLESGYLYRGSPARKLRPLAAPERDMLRYSAAHYLGLKDRCLSVVGISGGQ